MKKFISQVLVILLLTISIFAQSDNAPRIIDEFGSTSLEEQEVRSHTFSIEIQHNPNAIGHIKIFRKKGSSQISAYRFATRFKTYLTKISKISPDRIITEQCGVEDEIRVQFLIVPQKAEYKPCVEDLSFDLSKTFLFDSYWYSTENDFEGCCVIGQFDKEEAETSVQIVADILKKTPESKVRLIAYKCERCRTENGDLKPDSLRVTNEMLKEAKKVLAKNGVNSSRIITAKGKSKENRIVEIWFISKGSEIPKQKPESFPKKKRNKK